LQISIEPGREPVLVANGDISHLETRPEEPAGWFELCDEENLMASYRRHNTLVTGKKTELTLENRSAPPFEPPVVDGRA
jgi:hypothetical protein